MKLKGSTPMFIIFCVLKTSTPCLRLLVIGLLMVNVFIGLLVLDMEYWRPIFRQNFDSLDKYRKYSEALVLEEHPEWIFRPKKVQAEVCENKL